MYNFDKIVNRVGTNSEKWDKIKTTYKKDDLLPMWVADMDFEIAPEIVEAVQKRAAHLTYGYTYPGEGYYESIINWSRKRNGYELKKEWMLESPGVIPALKASIFAFTNVGDKILIQTPVYPPFHASVNVAGRELIQNKLKFDGVKYVIDFEDFEIKIKSGVKLFILCNPHNPIGRVWTAEELKRIVDICADNDVIIVCDEIHSDVTYKNHKHNVIFTVSQKAKDISIVYQAPSKTFNIAGLSTSFIIVENENMRQKLKDTMHIFGIQGPNLFGYTACEAAYSKGEKWLEEMICYIEKNADFVCEYIKEKLPKVKTFKPEGTYLMWLDFREYDMAQTELVNSLVNEAKVVLNNGTTFGEDGRGFMRLNIGCPKSVIKRCIDQIAEVL